MPTQIQDFKRVLERNSKSSGGQFRKADFHVHLPGSSDYEYKGEDAFEQMGRAISELRLSVANVVKHQEFPTKSELEQLQKYCPKTTLLPGAEINIFVDALGKKVGKDYYYHCLIVGDPNEDFEYPLKNAKSELSYRETGDYPSGFESSVKDVAKIITDAGQLFIPAHLHQKNSVENSRAIDDVYDDEAFLGLVGANCFSALEVRDPRTAEFFAGGARTKDGLDIPKSTCVRSSDAHHHDHLVDRNRFTWVQLEDASFPEVKAALQFPHRVRLDKPTVAPVRILGVHIVGQFLPEQWIELNPGVNAFIGCKGSGKTSVLECLRFVLNTEVPAERKESVAKHLQHILGPSGFVECLVQNDDGSNTLFSRRSDSPDRIQRINDDDTSDEVHASAGRVVDISILGWHEIEAVADQPQARIRLIDQADDYQRIRDLYDQTRIHVDDARNTMPLLQAAIRRFKRAKAAYKDILKKRQKLKELDQQELLAMQRKYERLVGLIGEVEAIKAQRVETANSLNDIIDNKLNIQKSGIPTEPSDDEWLKGQLTQSQEEAKGKIDEAKAQVVSAKSQMNSAADALEILKTALAQKFQQFRTTEYEPCIAKLPVEDKQILTRQIQVIEETKGLPVTASQAEATEKEVRSISQKMADICDRICGLRDQVKAFRTQTVQRLNVEIETLELELLPAGDRSRRTDYTKTNSEKSHRFFTDIDSYGGNELYEKLRELFRELTQVSKDDSGTYFKDPLFDAQFVDLLEVADDDDVQLKMRVGLAGMVPIQNLSAGQRCTAVFPLLLRNNRGPLVIDQPEDNLDNRHIASVVAPELLANSGQQQYFLTSHNANLVVLTDAGLIVHIDSDGRTGWIEEQGFLACDLSPVCNSVVDVLDGGHNALEARRQKYGTTPVPR